jgi:hypothetical protein
LLALHELLFELERDRRELVELLLGEARFLEQRSGFFEQRRVDLDFGGIVAFADRERLEFVGLGDRLVVGLLVLLVVVAFALFGFGGVADY